MHQVSTNLLNRKAAAAYLTIPIRTLDELTRAQKVACVRFNARCVRYRTEDLDALVSDLTDKRANDERAKPVAREYVVKGYAEIAPMVGCDGRCK